MKTFTFLLTLLLTITFGYAQELPLNFEVPEDDKFEAFNGTAASVTADPEDPNNSVLEMAGSGAAFDGASITLTTYVDLSDDTNNTVTFEVWSPVAATRDHLLKLEGGSSGPTELAFQTTMMGWQSVSVDFGANLGTEYPKLTLFTDFNNSATGTFYFDDIDGPNGAVVPVDAVPGTAAPVPTVADAEVYSIYNDTNGFSTTFPVQYPFGTLAGEPDLDDSASENKAYKFNFGIAGWGQGEGGPDDITAYNFVSFDYWADADVVGFNFVLISNDGGVTEHTYKVGVDEPVANETWTKVEIPLSFFTNDGFAANSFFQWKVDPLNQDVNNDGIVYMDNILFTQNTLGIKDLEQTKYTSYPNPVANVFHISSADASIQSVEIFNTLGKSVKQVKVNNTKADIDVNSLSAGIYFAKIRSNKGELSTVKMIKK